MERQAKIRRLYLSHVLPTVARIRPELVDRWAERIGLDVTEEIALRSAQTAVRLLRESQVWQAASR